MSLPVGVLIKYINYFQSTDFSLANVLPLAIKEMEDNGEREKPYGKSELFKQLKVEAVKKLTDRLIDMRRSCTSNPTLIASLSFKRIVKMAAALRNQIAIQTETAEAELFGSPRDNLDHYTYLDSPLYTMPYAETNKKIKALIKECIPKISNKDKGIRITNGKSRYTFRLAKDAGAESLLQAFSEKDNNRKHEICFSAMFVSNYKESIKPLINLIKDIKLSPSQKSLYELIPDPNIRIYTGRIEILTKENEWRTLTRHCAVLDSDEEGNITPTHLRNFDLHGFVTLLHTNHEDFVHHEASLVELFNKILDDKTEENETLLAMREFEYRLHHMVYHKRGGQSISEMIIESLKEAFCPKYQLKGHLEALAEPYLHNYMN